MLSWVLLILIPGSVLAGIAFGAVYLRRYFKTRDKRSLKAGLALLFGLPGLVALALYWLYSDIDAQQGATCYMPAVFGPASEEPETEEGRMRRAELQEQYRGRVSTSTFNKLSGGVFENAPAEISKVVSGPGERGGGDSRK